MSKRRWITMLFGILTVFCSVLTINVIKQPIIKAANSVFEMTNGGSIRTMAPYGLRFQVRMSEDIAKNAEKVGMIIFPADYLENSGVANDVYYTSVEDLVKNGKAGHKINLDLTQKLYEKDGYYYGNGAIVDIKDKNMTREFVGIAYYTLGGDTVWADTSKLANTTRAVLHVALQYYADESRDYEDNIEILAQYMSYMKGTEFKNMHFDCLPLAVDNGKDVAVAKIKAEYTDIGVKIIADVEDQEVSFENNTGLCDLVQISIQAVDNYTQTNGYTVNMLCNARGNNYPLQRWKTGSGWVNEQLDFNYAEKNEKYYSVCETTGKGYSIEFFVSYELLGVTKEEAMGNVRMIPLLRNRTDSEHNKYAILEMYGSEFNYPGTWFVIDENNKFTRKDTETFSLKSVSSEAEEMISKLAKITSDGYAMYTAKNGDTPFTDDSAVWCFDGLPSELLGTSYVGGLLNGGERVEVKTAGYVIVLCSQVDETTENWLKNENWTLLTDKAKCPYASLVNPKNNFQYVCSYYGKYFDEGDSFTVSGKYTVVFADTVEQPAQFSWKTTPAYISFEAAQEEFYSAEANVFNACPSIAVSNNGRLFASYITGGTAEPQHDNCVVIAYSDDNGLSWTKAFVIDSWINQKVNGSKGDLVLEADLRVDPKTNTLYGIYNLRKNVSAFPIMNNGLWLFTVENIDQDISKWEIGEHREMGLETGYVRNTFTILGDGRYAIIPNHYLNSEPNYIYFSSDNGKTWTKGGNIYVPQARDYDEPVLVERNDGSLWALFRTALGAVYESFSYDGGATWTVGQRTNIKNPCSRLNIAKLASGNLVMAYNDSSSGRLGMMVAISEDDGKTWTNKLCLFDGRASYPAIAVRNEGGKDTIHVIFDDYRYYDAQWRTNEEGTVQYYSSIYHYAFTEEELMVGGDSSDEDIELLIVGDSYTDSIWAGFENSFGTYGGETIGISGTEVEDWNNEAKIAEIVAKNPKRLFINIGINDIRRGEDGTSVGNAVVDYLGKLKESLPDTEIYYNMIVYTPNTSSIYWRIAKANEIIEAYIDGNDNDNIHKIDIREKLMFMDGTSTTPEDVISPLAKYEFLDSTNPGKDTMGNYNLVKKYLPGAESGNVTVHNGVATFDGTAALIPSSNETDIGERLQSFTVTFKIKANTNANDWSTPVGFGWNDWSATKWGNFHIQPGNTLLRFSTHSVDGTTNAYWGKEIGTLSDSNFSTVILSAQEGGKIAVYLDGVQKYSYDLPNDYSLTDSNMRFALGGVCCWGNVYNPFIGSLADVRVYDFAFDASEVSEFMANSDIHQKTTLAGVVDTSKFSDGLHMTAEGYAILSAAIKDATGIGISVNELNTITRAERRMPQGYERVAYASLGTVGGTSTNVFNVYAAYKDGALYLKAETTATLDKTVDEGVDFFVHFGNQIYTQRTQNTYSFNLYTKGGVPTGAEYNFPNNSKTLLQLNITRKIFVEKGKTTLYAIVPLNLLNAIDDSKISISLTSVKGNSWDEWKYKNITINRLKPLCYPVLHGDNTVSMDLTASEFRTLVEASDAYKSGKPVLENIATISTTGGTMQVLDMGDYLFTDRSGGSKEFKFDADLPDFLFGMKYAFNPIATGNFTVDEAGYVILMIPGISAYSTLQSNVAGSGFVTILSRWNNMGTIADEITYCIKWCEAGETYNFGKWNIAIGK